MNDPLHTGPCAGNEYDLTEFHDGALDGERRRSVELHLRTCARCREWLAEFAALDQALAGALPKPALAADFDQRLQARIAGLARTHSRTQLIVEEDQQYDRMLSMLGSGARWSAMANGVAAAAVAGCVLSAGHAWLSHWSPALPALGMTGPAAWPSLLGLAVAALALAFSLRRGLQVA
jgi:anti-sigma factor RsiW